MTSEKLTAKLSDGTEWKVVSNEPTAKGSENRVVWLMPLKPSPPKEVWIMTGPDGKKDVYTYEHNAIFNQGPRDSIARYILAPEPESESAPKCIFCDKPMELISQVGSARNYSCLPCISAKVKKAQDKKPAREWWEIRSPDGRAYPSCTTLEWARKFLRKLEQEDLIIVHVREVVSE